MTGDTAGAPLWTAADTVSATGGTATRDWQASGVSIDTRTLRPGDLFVALAAARDGHDFVAAALEAGAAAALVAHRPEGVADDAPLLLVPDVQQALESLGRFARARMSGRVVAVTGSAGKTSTKEMLVAALGRQMRVHAAQDSYNNHWGVPLTLARMPPDTEVAVIEIGMNHPGEIAPLSRQAAPHVVMVTTVAAAHLEAFAALGGLDGIAREKASIVQGLQPGGTAVLNGDLPQTPILVDAARAAGARVLTFGEGAANHHRLTALSQTESATTGRLRGWRTPMSLKIATAGRHHAVNALGVMAVVRAVGADRALALVGLAAWSPTAGRGLRERVRLTKGTDRSGAQDGDRSDDASRAYLIDDAYNANPASMAAALGVLAAARPVHGIGRFTRGRRIAVLGDMLELGPDAARLHAGLADLPAMDAIDIVHCAGPLMRHLHDALPEQRRGIWTDQAGALARRARALVDAGDIVLVKGSKASAVSLVVDAIRKLGHPAPTAAAGGAGPTDATGGTD